MAQKVLLITPPFTQFNTPYPATPYIKGFLNTKHIVSNQVDLGIEVILQLFSSKGLGLLFQEVGTRELELNTNCQRIFNLKKEYRKQLSQSLVFFKTEILHSLI